MSLFSAFKDQEGTQEWLLSVSLIIEVQLPSTRCCFYDTKVCRKKLTFSYNMEMVLFHLTSVADVKYVIIFVKDFITFTILLFGTSFFYWAF